MKKIGFLLFSLTTFSSFSAEKSNEPNMPFKIVQLQVQSRITLKEFEFGSSLICNGEDLATVADGWFHDLIKTVQEKQKIRANRDNVLLQEVCQKHANLFMTLKSLKEVSIEDLRALPGEEAKETTSTKVANKNASDQK